MGLQQQEENRATAGGGEDRKSTEMNGNSPFRRARLGGIAGREGGGEGT